MSQLTTAFNRKPKYLLDTMFCPICVELKQRTRDTINAKDMRGHLMGMHTKPELAEMLAKVLWNHEAEPAV